ncbi:hypothetical protein JCM16775_p2019 (plasmid) [Leptotrichia hofstadii]|uniref:Uncharacterized protein n=1 Tax=Leptotrichia hofstadii TaxID=157688 RepID=A0A510JKH7_9FUSO|nr:hypothetical protein [Leptotrichia hofstadii]BBM39794.1 hypothetical protein JCM16775_p2019 [Leptotrichia hofstadii]
MALDNPHCNSAVGRYYYAIYIRIMQLTRVLNKVKNTGDKRIHTDIQSECLINIATRT